ncbi:amino acid permease [Solibacillus sp. FSL R5-0449]|uniref:amino acid permease n=1 Tax=Solibacillus sp. FSL R5-0449 TaxID=2921639 RepID=UPI0030D33110
MKKVFRKKPISDLLLKSGNMQLPKTIGPFDLIMLGVGAIVGTGIFILPGTVSALHAGPAIVFSFTIAAVVCALAALCYSEFSSTVPVAGSAYSYSYIVFGEIIAWLVGWALLLEYGLATAAVATGWSGYFVSLLEGLSIHLPVALTGAFSPENGTYINLPAICIIFAIGALLSLGMKESTRFNALLVAIKLGVILLFIAVGVFYVKPENWTPFMPFGVSGVFTGAALVFFAYLGFDAVSSAAAEVKNPQRNMPIGIIGSLLVCTVLYIVVSLVLTGIVPYTDLNVTNPVSYAMQVIDQEWAAGIISLGAVIGMMTVILVMMYGGTRLLMAFARDGLMPKMLAQLSKKRKMPAKNIWLFTVIISFFAGFIPLDLLAELVNMGTLVAFIFVSAGILYLRKNKDLPKDRFKVPFYPVLPILSFILCIFLITQLSFHTWIACGVWFIIGLIVYFMYGKKHSTLNSKSE